MIICQNIYLFFKMLYIRGSMDKFLRSKVVRGTFTVAAIVVLLSLPLYFDQLGKQPSVLSMVSSSDQVIVQATVSACSLTLTVKPEKRIPPVNNWGTLLTVDIYNQSGQRIFNYQVTSDKYGVGTVNICDHGVFLPPGIYRFFVRGFSHLRRNFGAHYTFDKSISILDLSSGGSLLYAGETSNIFDNKINSLDISTQIVHLFTNDNKNDLNQDGKVNSLDISNTITNFFLVGD
jgi:hypothetical protein